MSPRRPILHLPQRKSRSLDLLRMTAITAVVTLAVMVGFAFAASAADKGGPASSNIFSDAPVAPARSWTGCYLRLATGMVAMNTKAGLESAPPAPVTIIELDGLGASGAVFNGGGGCDVQVGKSGIVIGAYADYSKFQNTEWNLNILPATAAINFNTALNNAWSVGLRGGVLIKPAVLAYAKVGYTQLEMDSFSGSAGGVAFPGALSFPRFTGWEVGGGLEAALGGGWSLTAEAMYGMYDAQSLPIAPGAPVNLRVEPNVFTARAGVSYHFNFLGQ